MFLRELDGRNVVIWGAGVEGCAAAAFIRSNLPHQKLTIVDNGAKSRALASVSGTQIITGEDEARKALSHADIIVKSPGISLYDPFVKELASAGVLITSLLNLWFAQNSSLGRKTILVTGTKGKSTTASLIGHALNRLGRSSFVAGNIGVPLTEVPEQGVEFVVVEASSYQLANFDGNADIGVVVTLFPEHLDWHKSEEDYYRDKLRIIGRCRFCVVSRQVYRKAKSLGLLSNANLKQFAIVANRMPPMIDEEDAQDIGRNVLKGGRSIGRIRNRYLARQHNMQNLCLAIEVLEHLGISATSALEAFESFRGLPHRQYELGIKDEILFVDDSISTTPQSAIAALEAYHGKTRTLIAGGYDRNIPYQPLVAYIRRSRVETVICMGKSGEKIAKLLRPVTHTQVHTVTSMNEAVAIARLCTPKGGVVLLSPAAPSYGMFENFEQRGKAFAEAIDIDA